MKRAPTWSHSGGGKDDGAGPNPFVSLPARQALDDPLTPPKRTKEHRAGSPLLSTATRGEVERRRQRQQITALAIELERLTSQLAAERTKSEQVSRTKDSRILELERDRQFLYDNERHTKEEMERLVSRLKGEQAELGRQVMTFQAQEEQLRVELQARNGEKRALERRISVLEADLRSAREQADARVRAVQEELDRRNEIMVKQEILIEELRQQDQREGERRAEGEETQCQSVEMPSLGEFLERIHNLEATNRRLQVERKTLLEAAQSARILTERLHTAEVRLEQYQQRLESQTLVSSTPKPAPPIADTSAAEITNGHSTRQVRQLIERTAELAKVQEALGEAEAERKRLKAEMERLANQVGLLEKALKELQVENVNLRGQHLGCSSQENLLRSELSLLRERLEAAERTELATRNILMKIKVHPTSMEE